MCLFNFIFTETLHHVQVSFAQNFLHDLQKRRNEKEQFEIKFLNVSKILSYDDIKYPIKKVKQAHDVIKLACFNTTTVIS